MKYSVTTGCLYFDNQSAPQDAVSVSDSEAESITGRTGTEVVSVIDGKVFISKEPDDVKLIRAKSAKADTIEAAFKATELAPISVNGWQFKGGFTSGLAIDAQRRAAERHRVLNPKAPDTVSFFDANGQVVTVPLSSDIEIDADDICLSIHTVVALNTFKYEQLRKAVWAASTIDEVNAISWE